MQKYNFDDLWGETADVSLLGSSIVVWCIVVCRHHDVTIARSKGVAVSVVQVTSSSSVTSRVVCELGDHIWRRTGRVPARLQGSSSRVGGIAIDWVAINKIANLGVCAGNCGICNAA
jgi:hypothetical protein